MEGKSRAMGLDREMGLRHPEACRLKPCPSRAFAARLTLPVRPSSDRMGLGHLSGSVSPRLGV